MSLILIYKILGLFVNAMTTDYKYYSENSHQSIEMKLSKKQKTFSESFATFMKSSSMFEIFYEKDDPHISCISDVTDCERRDYINV